jgi:hypothetical protein
MFTRNEISVRRVLIQDMDIEEQLWADNVTKWEFTLPVETARIIHNAVGDALAELWQKVTMGGMLGCPALGEWTEDYSWADLGLLNSLVISVNVHPEDGRVDIFCANRPDNREDWVDPEHEEWKTGGSSQWIDVANFIRRAMKGEVQW